MSGGLIYRNTMDYEVMENPVESSLQFDGPTQLPKRRERPKGC